MLEFPSLSLLHEAELPSICEAEILAKRRLGGSPTATGNNSRCLRHGWLDFVGVRLRVIGIQTDIARRCA